MRHVYVKKRICRNVCSSSCNGPEESPTVSWPKVMLTISAIMRSHMIYGLCLCCFHFFFFNASEVTKSQPQLQKKKYNIQGEKNIDWSPTCKKKNNKKPQLQVRQLFLTSFCAKNNGCHCPTLLNLPPTLLSFMPSEFLPMSFKHAAEPLKENSRQ